MTTTTQKNISFNYIRFTNAAPFPVQRLNHLPLMADDIEEQLVEINHIEESAYNIGYDKLGFDSYTADQVRSAFNKVFGELCDSDRELHCLSVEHDILPCIKLMLQRTLINRLCVTCSTPYVEGHAFENHNEAGDWMCKDCWVNEAMISMDLINVYCALKRK